MNMLLRFILPLLCCGCGVAHSSRTPGYVWGSISALPSDESRTEADLCIGIPVVQKRGVYYFGALDSLYRVSYRRLPNGNVYVLVGVDSGEGLVEVEVGKVSSTSLAGGMFPARAGAVALHLQMSTEKEIEATTMACALQGHH